MPPQRQQAPMPKQQEPIVAPSGVPSGTDKKLTLSFGEDVALELTGRGNYGMKPKEVKIETDKSNSIFLTTEKDVKSYNIVLECYKETGFKEE